MLTDTEFLVDNGVFKMSLFAENEESNFTLKGEIGNGKFFIGMPTSYLLLDKFDELIGLDVEGKGTLSFEILDNSNKPGLIMKSRKDFKDLSIHGFLIDKIEAEVNYLFDENEGVLNITPLLPPLDDSNNNDNDLSESKDNEILQ